MWSIPTECSRGKKALYISYNNLVYVGRASQHDGGTDLSHETDNYECIIHIDRQHTIVPHTHFGSKLNSNCTRGLYALNSVFRALKDGTWTTPTSSTQNTHTHTCKEHGPK